MFKYVKEAKAKGPDSVVLLNHSKFVNYLIIWGLFLNLENIIIFHKNVREPYKPLVRNA